MKEKKKTVFGRKKTNFPECVFREENFRRILQLKLLTFCGAVRFKPKTTRVSVFAVLFEC